MFITPTAPNNTVQLESFPDEISPDERHRLILDPRLHRPLTVRSNREWLKDLAEWKDLHRDLIEVHDKLLQSHILFHDLGTTINELRIVLRNGRVGYDLIDQLISFLSDRSKFVVLETERDGTKSFYLRPKCERPQGPCEWISQLAYL